MQDMDAFLPLKLFHDPFCLWPTDFIFLLFIANMRCQEKLVLIKIF